MFSCTHVTIYCNSRWFYQTQGLYFLNFRVWNIGQRLRHILENQTHKPYKMERIEPDTNPTWPPGLFNVMVPTLRKVKKYITSGKSHYLMCSLNKGMMCGLETTGALFFQIGTATCQITGISTSITSPNMTSLPWLTKCWRRPESPNWSTLGTRRARPSSYWDRGKTKSCKAKSRNSSGWGPLSVFRT